MRRRMCHRLWRPHPFDESIHQQMRILFSIFAIHGSCLRHGGGTKQDSILPPPSRTTLLRVDITAAANPHKEKNKVSSCTEVIMIALVSRTFFF